MYTDTINVLAREKNNAYVRIQQSHSTYAAMIESMDESVGRIMNAIRDKGPDKNTLVMFTSDNGGYSASNFPLPGQKADAQVLPTSVVPLRAGKGWYYEGGIKVPAIIFWPGVTKPGSVIEEMVTSTDFYPTLLEIAGLNMKNDQIVDGISFVPLLKDHKSHLEREALYWHFPHYHNSGQYPASAIRKDNFKLIYTYEDEKYELYDLSEDPEEKHDISGEFPQKVMDLAEELEAWKVKVNADVPY